jgi:hypothetical protein
MIHVSVHSWRKAISPTPGGQPCWGAGSAWTPWLQADGARSGGRPRLLPMVESAEQQQHLLAAAADTRPAPAAAGTPQVAQGWISAPPPSALQLPPSPAAGRVNLMGAAAQPLANGLWPPAGGQRALLPQLPVAANWSQPGGWPGGNGLPPWDCRLPAYGGGVLGGAWPNSRAAMSYSGDIEVGTAGGPAAVATVPRIPRLCRRQQLPVAARILRLRRWQLLPAVARAAGAAG